MKWSINVRRWSADGDDGYPTDIIAYNSNQYPSSEDLPVYFTIDSETFDFELYTDYNEDFALSEVHWIKFAAWFNMNDNEPTWRYKEHYIYF